MDPNSIAALLQQAPYHVDSLLTMYDLYRSMGENAYAEVRGAVGESSRTTVARLS